MLDIIITAVLTDNPFLAMKAVLMKLWRWWLCTLITVQISLGDMVATFDVSNFVWFAYFGKRQPPLNQHKCCTPFVFPVMSNICYRNSSHVSETILSWLAGHEGRLPGEVDAILVLEDG